MTLRFTLGAVGLLSLLTACGGNGTDAGGPASDAGTDGALQADAADAGSDADAAADDGGDSSTQCTPGESRACYSGPPGTDAVGPCHAGSQVCAADGSGFGDCSGELLPQTETCETPEDDDCDGQANEDGAGCVCVPGTTESCYSGPAGTQDIGACVAGLRTCNALGTGWGSCEGEVLPAPETCSTVVDDDCDGLVNEEGTGCVCLPGSSLSCYSGPAGSVGVGTCKAGTQTCEATGTGYGACQGEVVPVSESCATWTDDDCDDVPECPGDAVSTTPYSTADHVLGASERKHATGFDVLVRTGSSPAQAQWLGFDENGAIAQTLAFPQGVVPTAIIGRDDCSKTYLSGSYVGTPDFGLGPLPASSASGMFVASYDEATQQFANVYGFPGAFAGAAPTLHAIMEQSECDVFVGGVAKLGADLGTGPLIGSANGAGFLLALDKFGVRYARSLQIGGGGQITSVDGVDAVFEAAAIGTFEGVVDFGFGPLTAAGTDLFFMTVDFFDGEPSKPVQFGGPGNDTVMVGVDASQNLGETALAGTTDGGIDFGGGPLAAGMFVALLNNSGGQYWSKSFPSCTPVAIRPRDEQYSAVRAVFVAADCTSPVDFGSGTLPAGRVLMKLDGSTGASVWSRPIPSSDQLFLIGGMQMAGAGNNGIFAVGSTTTPMDFWTGVSVAGPGVFATRFMP